MSADTAFAVVATVLSVANTVVIVETRAQIARLVQGRRR